MRTCPKEYKDARAIITMKIDKETFAIAIDIDDNGDPTNAETIERIKRGFDMGARWMFQTWFHKKGLDL